MTIIADALHSKHGLNEIEASGDVPYKVMLGKRAIYLGAHLRKVLRTEMGYSDAQKSEIANNYLQMANEEMHDLQETAKANDRLFSNQEIVSEAFSQEALNMSNRYRIRHGGTL